MEKFNMRIKKYFDSFFVLSKSERNGAIVLFVIILLLIIFRFLIPTQIRNDKKFVIDYDTRIDQLEKIKDSLNHKNYNVRSTTSRADYKKVIERKEIVKSIPSEMFQFDPNLVSLEELIRLGFTTYAARNLIKYREKGGVFHKSEDLKSIYGVDSVLIANILPYVVIPEQKATNITIEINGADSAFLTSLKGVGPGFAARICKYRNYLGGFVKLDQLKEVYQFPEETYLKIKDFLILDSTKVQKINVNFADVKDLKKHPYCGYENARKIIDYRSKKGYIQSVEQLLLDSILEPSVFIRFSPYLKVQ